MRSTMLHAGIATLWACCALGQTPAFDVVSIKPNHSGDMRAGGMSGTPNGYPPSPSASAPVGTATTR